MRLLFVVVVLSLLVLPTAVISFVAAALGDQPLVEGNWRPTAQDIARARSAVKAHDPRSLPESVTRRVSMTEREVNLAGNYALNFVGEGAFAASLDVDRLRVRGAVRLPENPFGRYLNFTAILSSAEGATGAQSVKGRLPSLSQLKLGALDVPAVVANKLLFSGLSLAYSAYGRALRFEARELIQWVSIMPAQLQIAYRLPKGAVASLQSALISDDDRERLRLYHAAMVHELGTVEGHRASVMQILPRLFKLAHRRSRTGDPVAENRALLIVLANVGSGRGLVALVPESRTWPAVPKVRLTLQGRPDFAQHFLTSAGLAVLGGVMLADSIGLFKEVQDAEGASGFSFADLAADRAGTRFGEVAVRSRESAEHVQAMTRSIRSEGQIMPPARDLPEGLSAAEFKRRFDAVGSPAYRRIEADIEQRLDTIRLYQE